MQGDLVRAPPARRGGPAMLTREPGRQLPAPAQPLSVLLPFFLPDFSPFPLQTQTRQEATEELATSGQRQGPAVLMGAAGPPGEAESIPEPLVGVLLGLAKAREPLESDWGSACMLGGSCRAAATRAPGQETSGPVPTHRCCRDVPVLCHPKRSSSL